MAKNSEAIQELFKDDDLPSPTGRDSSALIGYLQRLQMRCGDRLNDLKPEDFARAWVLQRVSNEVLQNSIEDNYVDTSEYVAAIVRTLSELRSHDGWIDPRFTELLKVCRSIAKRSAPKPLMVELTLESCSVIARLAAQDQPLLQVSSRTYPLVPILEDNANSPHYIRGIQGAYIETLQQLKVKYDITSLCFVEKDVGPVGALSMFSSLVSALNCTASIYRMGHWAKRGKVAAYRPNKADRLAIVYDLMVSGDAIQKVTEDLTSRFGATVNAAVVLFAYDRSLTPLKVGSQSVEIAALGWYEDLAEEINNFRYNRVPSSGIKLAPNSWNGVEGFDSTKEDPMFNLTDQEETLSFILDGLEDCDLQELIAVTTTIPSPPFQVHGRSEKQLRNDLVSFVQSGLSPESLQSIWQEIRRLALDFLNRD